jgi:hypothetical protein
MQRKWKPGDLVVVVTVNRGRPILPSKARKPGKAEAWLGEIAGPSVLGPGWWNVRRVHPNGWLGYTFAVPASEIKPRKR